MIRKAFNIALLTTAMATLVACNTVRGAGEDVQSAADAVDKKT
jgi:predicted small secreted protein